MSIDIFMIYDVNNLCFKGGGGSVKTKILRPSSTTLKLDSITLYSCRNFRLVLKTEKDGLAEPY